MPIRYINRKGVAYLLMVGTTRSGRPNYYCVQESKGKKSKRRQDDAGPVPPKGAPLDAIPEGYEVHEKPETAQVFLRRSLETQILPEERESVESGVRRFAGLQHFLVDVEADALVVYLPDRSENDLGELFDALGSSGLMSRHEFSDYMMTRSNFQPMMRFSLISDNPRRFSVDRWCFRGSIDGWFPLMNSTGDLAELLERFAPALGTEMFFELF